MFVGIELAARIICSRKGELSLPRIFLATETVFSASAWLFPQTFNFLKSLTPGDYQPDRERAPSLQYAINHNPPDPSPPQ